MSRLLERARTLDRRVFKDRQLTAPEWRRRMSRWPWVLVLAALLLLLAIGFLLTDGRLAGTVIGAEALPVAFAAGRMKAEHERLEGRPGIWARQRPPGL